MPISMSMYQGLLRHDGQLADLFLDLKDQTDILKLFPITDIGAPRLSARSVDRLPQGGYRDLYEQFPEDVMSTKSREDHVALYGGKFPVDIAYDDWTRDPMIGDPVETNYQAHIRASALDLTDDVINSTLIETPEGYKKFHGLHQRLLNGDQDPANLVACASGANLLVRQSAANAVAYFEFLDEAMMEVGLFNAPEESGPRGAILMNKKSFLGHQAAAKVSGLTDTNVNMLGYSWATYNGVPIIRVPLNSQKEEIISNDATASDATTGGTFVYIVRLASPDDPGDGANQDPRDLLENPGSDGLQLIQAGMLRRLGPRQKELEQVEYGYQWQLGVSTVTDSSCIAALENIDFSKA